ncbi:NAD(P)H-binding protein [Phytoactinopolyspora endophytica]|uniref:NAD(P)H-binding protein n=1 Tax=Phytoactinopolyspora endophytica TaxID=1642495 RepID=UPI00101CE9F4|nr:NAD(P)H-binding protein [Phytoactinopolyspora endophytica]
MIVVTGATGNVGRSLVRTLKHGGTEITAVSRGASGAHNVPDGVRHQPADLSDPQSLKAPFDGAEALFLLVAGEMPREIIDVAQASGIQRLVLLSSQGAGTRPEAYHHPRSFEDAVRGSGLDWTILRSGGLNSNAFAWAEAVRARRTVIAPFGDVALPTIDPADIADAAATILRDGRHSGLTYDLTGPEPITPRQRASAIGAALGTPVRFIEQDRDEARAEMLRFMPERVVDGTLSILGDPLPGEQRVGTGVERILGRAPRTFADWAVRNVAAFTNAAAAESQGGRA